MEDQPRENKVIIDGITYHGGLNQPRHFVKVNVDCWENIFDFLSFRDVLAMSQTCQRMRQIGGYYFRENFHGTVCNLHKFLGPRFRINDTSIDLENCDFLRFIDTISIYGQMEHLEYYSDLLRSLTTLQLCFISFNGNENFHELECVLNNIESVEFNQCYIYGNSASQLLALCPKLKRLRIDAVDFESTVQLDCLNNKLDLIDIERLEFADRLKTLHANGFYKKLHLSIDYSDDDLILERFLNGMGSFKGLEVLYNCPFHTNISHLIGLKELYLRDLNDEIDLKSLAIK